MAGRSIGVPGDDGRTVGADRASTGCSPRSRGDAGLIGVGAHHLGDKPAELASEHALAAADVERPLTARRDSPKHDGVVDGVVVPAAVPLHPLADFSHGSARGVIRNSALKRPTALVPDEDGTGGSRRKNEPVMVTPLHDASGER